MKRLFSIFLAFLFQMFSFAQEQAPPVELFFITEGAPTYPIIACTLMAQSQCWAISLPVPPQPGGYYLSNDYDNSIYVPRENNMGQQSAGFDFVTSMGGAPGTGYPDFAYGLYKVTITGSNKYFYLDYRDYLVGFYSPPFNGHKIDLWIKYKSNSDKFEYSSDSNDYFEITNRQLLNIWDIKQKGAPQTSLFPDYWDNCLALIPSQNNNPRLIWGTYPEPVDLAGYNIYRKIGSGSFSYIHFNNEMQLDYVDADYIITEPTGAQLQYYVKAGYVSRELSEPTNIVTTQGISLQKVELILNSESDTYNLSNCYPNPFNPSTQIDYSIKSAGTVTLKVFNMLGQEVATLVNQRKEPGNYSVTFNASDFPSGIYVYKLTANDFTDTKKLMLVK